MKLHFTAPPEDPEHSSAESTLCISLLNSDSREGKAEALALKHLFATDLGAEVVNVKLNSFDFHDQQSVNRDLAAFMTRVSDLLNESDVTRTSYAPMGGYK